MRTEFIEAAGIESEALKAFDDYPCLESKDVADATVYVLSTPPHVQV